MDAADVVLMLPPPTCPYGVRPRGQTPIYDQLRGERVNADVSTTGPDSQRVDHRGNHRLLNDAQVPAVVFDHQVQQELTSPRISTILCGYIRRVGQQATDNGLPRCGDREHPFPGSPGEPSTVRIKHVCGRGRSGR